MPEKMLTAMIKRCFFYLSIIFPLNLDEEYFEMLRQDKFLWKDLNDKTHNENKGKAFDYFVDLFAILTPLFHDLFDSENTTTV